MSIEELPQSASGRIRLRNLTFYNTDDIITLVNRIEAERPSASCPWSYAVERSTGKDTPKILEFREFTGRPRLRAPAGTGQEVLLLAPTRWRRPLIFRLLGPDKLYGNPIQALVNSSEDRTLPKEMVSELGNAIDGLFRQKVHVPFKPLDVSDIVIRINKTKAKGSQKRGQLLRKAELLEDATRRLCYQSATALRSAGQMKGQAEAMVKHAKALGLDITKVEQILHATEQASKLFSPFEERLAALTLEARKLVDAA
jgi:hypothetical protein